MSKYALGFALVLAAIIPSAASAQTPATQVVSAAPSSQTYLDFQVDQSVKIKSAVAPIYPDRLKNGGIEGQVIVQFIVDENGAAVMDSFKVLRSNDSAFSEAVKKAVSQTTYIPAELQGRKVRQLVQQPYKFAAR
jgi:protein TonB